MTTTKKINANGTEISVLFQSLIPSNSMGLDNTLV